MGRGDCVSHGSAQRDDLLCMCVTGGGDLCNAVKRCGDGCGEAWRFLLRPWFEGPVRIGEFSVMGSRLPSADRVRPAGRVLKPALRVVSGRCGVLLNAHISANTPRFPNRHTPWPAAQFLFFITRLRSEEAGLRRRPRGAPPVLSAAPVMAAAALRNAGRVVKTPAFDAPPAAAVGGSLEISGCGPKCRIMR